MMTRRRRDLVTSLFAGLALTVLFAQGCSKKTGKPSPNAAGPGANAVAPTANVSSSAAACAQPKSDKTFITNVVQDLTGGQPTSDQLAFANGGSLDRAAFVDQILASPEAEDGITRFVGNLFRVSNITADPNGDRAQEAALVADLKQEPIVLVLRNKTKPWPYFFQTTDIYCTANTAKLYDYPIYNVDGFVSCKLPPGRAGFLGLVSVLRSTSPDSNPQAFYRQNNNYHRVSATVYFATGRQMQAATNGPKGEGRGLPLASCVPATDMRATKGGLIFGTAAIPLVGSTCASCHSPDMGPLSIAFRQFGTKGEMLKPSDLDQLEFDDNNATSTDELRALLGETTSCWSPDGKAPPSTFDGEAGLGQIIAADAPLGQALGVQIPQLLGNVSPTPEMSASIADSYQKGGRTLLAAMKGYFLSQTYQCDKAQ